MPRRNTDYTKTVIYRIVCNDLSVVYCYVGSTTDFTKRKSDHKRVCNNPNSKSYKLKLYTTIRENGGWSNWSTVLVENYPCDNGEQARQRERYFYELYNAELNMVRPIITYEEKEESKKESDKRYYTENIDRIKERNKEYRDNNVDRIKEYKKQYRDNNVDKIKEINKEYRDNNVDKINEKQKKYYINNADKLKEKHNCECGGKYITTHKTTHFKTNRHQNFIETNATI
jgi:hypothetical protein